jgi:hypothetical protein
MIAAAVVFGIAAMGGLFLAVRRFNKRDLPLPVALAHGALAATALVLLIIPIAGGSAASTAKVALGIFVVAALGGFVLFSFQLRKQELPLALVVVHGLAAVVAFVILLVGIVG